MSPLRPIHLAVPFAPREPPRPQTPEMAWFANAIICKSTSRARFKSLSRLAFDPLRKPETLLPPNLRVTHVFCRTHCNSFDLSITSTSITVIRCLSCSHCRLCMRRDLIGNFLLTPQANRVDPVSRQPAHPAHPALVSFNGTRGVQVRIFNKWWVECAFVRRKQKIEKKKFGFHNAVLSARKIVARIILGTRPQENDAVHCVHLEFRSIKTSSHCKHYG